MFIENLILRNFRNYKDLQINFKNNINILIGENAQGKTNIIEAIYYTAFVSSHRTHIDRDLIYFNEEFSTIKTSCLINNKKKELELILTSKGKKAKINKVDQKRLSDYVATLNAVLFAPEDLDLIKGTPSNRRRFIDMTIIQLNPLYIHYLNQLNKALKQRNEYLKSVNNIDSIYYEVLTTNFIDLCVKIYLIRMNFVNNLNEYIRSIHLRLSNNVEILHCEYLSIFEDLKECTEESIKNRLVDEFKRVKEQEIRNRTTLIGPHKDDLLFYINGVNAKKFASQGQQRSIVLSLKLAELEMIHDLKGEYPILLLDDVLSELDHIRKTNLLDSIHPQIQTFITTTSLDGIDHEVLMRADEFVISNAKIEEVKAR